MNKLITQLARDPRKIFLLDGIGALLTAILLLFLLAPFAKDFGMPVKTLHWLATIAIVFFVYSISCYFFVGKNWPSFLRIIIFVNLAYCFVTAILIVYHYQTITLLGLTYFIAEIIVICMLVFVEWSLLKKVSN